MRKLHCFGRLFSGDYGICGLYPFLRYILLEAYEGKRLHYQPVSQSRRSGIKLFTIHHDPAAFLRIRPGAGDIFRQNKLAVCLLRLLPDELLVLRSNAREPHEAFLHVLVVVFFKKRYKLQPYSVSCIQHLAVRVICDRLQSLFRTVFLYFISVYIEQRAYDLEAAFIAFVGDACQSVRSRSAQDPEQHCLRLIVSILSHSYLHRSARLLLAHAVSHKSGCDFLCSHVKRIVPRFPSGFFARHGKLLCQSGAVHLKGSAFKSHAAAELFRIFLVPFRLSRSELMVEMHRIYPDIHLPAESCEYMKKAY